MIEIRDDEFSLLRAYLHDCCGIDVPPDKRYLFSTRLAELLRELSCTNFSSFYQRLNSGVDPALHHRLVEAMTTNETSFFRDRHPFDTLRDTIVPTLVKRRVGEARYLPARLRFLSVGCATGEEPFSIAICVRQWLASQKLRPMTVDGFSILAADISASALTHARCARYSARQLRQLPPVYLQDYFEPVDEQFAVKPELRAMVRFVELNLADPVVHLGQFDVIFCRNVIIYFSLDLKRRILEQFSQMLNPGGVLLIGASENLYNLSDRFELAQRGATTYYTRKDRR